MMRPTKTRPGQILIPRQTLLQDDPRLTGPEKTALLIRAGLVDTGEITLARKNEKMRWSVFNSTAGWTGQSTEDKETIHTDLYDASGHQRGYVQVDWFNEKETPEFRLFTRIDPHSPRSDENVSAIDRETGAIVKTMPFATTISPALVELFYKLDIWHSSHLYMQTWIDLIGWLDENFPDWKDPLAYWGGPLQ